MRPWLLLPVLLLVLPAASSADEGSAADHMERGRSLDRILDITLLPAGKAIEGERTLYLLIDPTTSLQTSGFTAALEGALARNEESLGATRIGVARVGAPRITLEPTRDRSRIVESVADVVAEPVTSIQNIYADVRRVAAELRKGTGTRDLVLVTLENGDAEDDVEGTARALSRAKVRLWVVAREAFLSDTYWVSRTQMAPRGLDAAGPEAAFVEMPWGYVFQQAVANENVLSGFPMYGLSRLAAEAEGRVFLYYPPSATGHQCHVYGTCLFCTGDHLPTGEAYRTHRLQDLAPPAVPRTEAYAIAASDPYFRAVLRAWERASKAGIVRSRPSVKRIGSSLKPERRQLGRWTGLGSTLAFASQATKAERLAGTCTEILRDLEAALDGREGSRRYRAIAETTRVMLHVTRVNLLAFAAFCREVGPVLLKQDPASLVPPEAPRYTGDGRFIGIGYTNLSLCHGVAPFHDVRLPGGEEMERELTELEPIVDGFLARYAHTPFAQVVRKQGLAMFHFTVRGKYVPPPDRDVPGSSSEETTTPPGRPNRGGGSSTGGGGTTTGGG